MRQRQISPTRQRPFDGHTFWCTYQPLAPFTHWLHLISDSLQRTLQAFRASLQRALFLRRQLRLHDFEHSGMADDAWQRQRDTKFTLVAADRNCRAFITQHDFGDPRRHNANAVLAGVVTLDDRDIGVTDVLFQLGADIVEFFAALFDEFRQRYTGDPRGRPQKDLGGTVVADHLRLDAGGITAEMFAEMHAKAQAVEIGSRAQYAIVPGCLARNVGERIGRIGDRDQHRLRSGANDLRDDVAIDGGVLVE